MKRAKIFFSILMVLTFIPSAAWLVKVKRKALERMPTPKKGPFAGRNR